MIATILLSAEHRRPYLVLFAAMLALMISTFIAVVLGVLLSTALPLDVIVYISGILFVGLGLYTLTKREDEEDVDADRQITFFSMFSLVLVSELGDKSQIAVLALAAQSLFPVLVFFGAMIGFFLLNTMGAISGDKIGNRIPLKLIRIFTGIVFITIGFLIILGFL